MSELNQHVIKKSLIKRVFNFAVQNELGGLVNEFGRRTSWMRTPIEQRTGSNIYNLHVFLKAVSCDSLPDDSAFFSFIKEHQGQPRNVCRMDLFAKIDGMNQRWNGKPSNEI